MFPQTTPYIFGFPTSIHTLNITMCFKIENFQEFEEGISSIRLKRVRPPSRKSNVSYVLDVSYGTTSRKSNVSCSMREFGQKDDFKFHWKCRSEKINHLYFTNDHRSFPKVICILFLSIRRDLKNSTLWSALFSTNLPSKAI